MEIYIEKAFLDDFYLSLNNPPTKEEECLLAIFSKYGDVNKYVNVNIDSVQSLEKQKNDNPIFSSLFEVGSLTLIETVSFFEYIKASINNNPKLVFCLNKKDWFERAEKMGCICLSFENFKNKIKAFLDCHMELTLFIEEFKGWSSLNPLSSFPNNELFLNDDYILTDTAGQKIDDNLIPIFQNILNDKSNSIVHIFTKDFRVKPDVSEKRKEKAKKVYKRLKKNCLNNNEFVIYSKEYMPNSGMVLHGRTIVSHYFKIYSPKGLNLIPFKKSNEIFRVMTIFDKRTYIEIKEELKIYNDWLTKLNAGSWKSLEFVNYPDHITN